MPENVTEPALDRAVVAGLASFLSLCMLPAIPAFLAQLAGTSLGVWELRRRDVSWVPFCSWPGFGDARLGAVLNAVLREPLRRFWSGSHTLQARWLSSWGLLHLSILDRQLSILRNETPPHMRRPPS